MIEGVEGSGDRRDLGRVEHRGRWVAWGLALQTIGVGIPVTAALRRANQDGVLGSVTHYTVRLVWHEMLRSRADVALIVLGVVLFVIGSVVLARPFARRRTTLFVGVPVAATAGLVVLGAIALVIAALIALVASPGDANWDALFNGLNWPGRGQRKRRK
jgi:hypothetical protein